MGGLSCRISTQAWVRLSDEGEDAEFAAEMSKRSI